MKVAVTLCNRGCYAPCLGALILGWVASAGAETPPQPFPQPLTLEAALVLGETHPGVTQAQAALAGAAARQQQVAADTAWNLNLEGRLRYIDPNPTATDSSHEDHQLGLRLSKMLYDFGRSESTSQAAAARQQSAGYQLTDQRNAQRLTVMERFLAVLLADLADASADEAMAVAYVALDRLRQRRELGQVDEVTLLAKEAAYQSLRTERVRAQHNRQASRARLAAALGHVGALPATLTSPPLLDLQRPIPTDLNLWLAQAQSQNPSLQALQAQLAASTAAKAAARAGTNPTLQAEVEAYTYTRDLSGRDEFRAGLVLQVPLLTGGRVDALAAEREAERQAIAAQLLSLQLEIRRQLTEHWLALQGLRAEQEALQAGMRYRDRYLDRSRTLYEMEVQADLGDAMVQIAQQKLQLAQNEYAQLHTWAKIDALLGHVVWDAARLTPAGSSNATPQ